MQLFVDTMDGSGRYRGARAPCMVDPYLPVGVLGDLMSLDAGARAVTPVVFHVESGRLLDDQHLCGEDIGELDTLIVIDVTSAPCHERLLLRHWQLSGGAARRCSHATLHALAR